MRKTVCLIGRPNTGKSTLFNRLIKEKKAIIHNLPGVTRDRIYGIVNFDNKSFHLIDTGGIDLGEEKFNKSIKMQAELAIDESDVIVFVIDGKTELTSNDILIANMLKKTNKKIIVAVNKIDDNKHDDNIYNYYELGFDAYIPVSGEHNRGINELLFEITNDFNPYTTEEDESILKFSIIGRPNTGKSSLINALLNEERVIVSNEAGTTRDAIDTRFTYEKNNYIVIDTAGMRKKGKIYEQVEKYSLIRSLKAIDRSDVCVLIIDAKDGIIEHDKHIASYALDAGKAIVLVVNKWDLIKDKNIQMKKWIKDIRNNFQFIPYASIVFLSSLTKARIHTLMPEILKAYESATKEIKTSVLNDIIRDAYALHPAPSYKGRRLKIYFVHQEGTKPPKFNFSVNNKKLVHFSYERYLENKIRESFELTGTPVIIKFTNRGDKDE
ncbi:MAG: ribosome biogenesis GTPase Der [Bacilli bacterium]|nr:ribosome biogenesis GTPase Der [Bacilli bacterium]MDD4406628.1 ribosome biogenesis GTPase Der [Bacilli bacterium]